MNRRSLLRMGTLAASCWQLAPQLYSASNSAVDRRASDALGRAKNCIYLFLCGGPSQPDLWDLKPDAPSGIRSTFKAISTNVPGIQFGELIPQVARHADKLAVIRSLTHSNNDHNGAIVHSLMGQLPARVGDLYQSRHDHPGIGAILHRTLGPSGRLPAWVVLPRPFTTYSPPYKGQSAGFLGGEYDPLVFQKPTQGSLTDAPLRLDALIPAADMDQERFERRNFLREEVGRPLGGLATEQWSGFQEQAHSLLTRAEARRVFDLGQESDRVRDRYGRNEYGQSFLMARRLIEAGVRFVNVFWTFFDTKGCQFNLWDNHGVPSDVCGIDGQLTGLQQLTHQYCTPSFDRSFSALLEDLEQRGLLDETLVAVVGEFGRTPKINATSGRDHWAHCYTQLLAGGGVRGGQVYGASDSQGAYVKDRPVTPDDFAATILHAFGISPETAIPDATGRPVRVTTGRPIVDLF